MDKFRLVVLTVALGALGAAFADLQQHAVRHDGGRVGPLGHTGIEQGGGVAVPVAGTPAGPVVTTSAAHGVSRAVRDLPKGHLVAPRKRNVDKLQAITGRPVPKGFVDPVAQRAIAVADAASATTVRGFDGINSETSGCGCAPPDTVGAAGTTQYVQMVNSAFAVYSKSGQLQAGPLDINTLFQSLPDGSMCKVTNDGDPVVFFDQFAKRWVLSQFAVSDNDGDTATPTPYAECIAVSKTDDATGEYYIYEFVFPEPFDVFQDYPHFGRWTDAYYMSTHQFPSSYGGGGVFAFERDKMLAGQPARLIGFTVAGGNTGYNGHLPADLDGNTLPPPGAPGYFIEVDDGIDVGPVDALRIFEFKVDWANPANSTFGVGAAHTANVTLPVAEFAEPFCLREPAVGLLGFPTCVPQPGETQLDALGDRLMFRAAYRNFGDHESVVVNHSVVVDDVTQQIGPRWYEVRGLSTTPVIHQQGTLAPGGTDDPLYRWMGSVAMDKFGNIGLAYSTSSHTAFPSIAYVSQAANGVPGVMSAETVMAAGGAVQPGVMRWGDYSNLTVDPVNDCTFWYTTEYVKEGHTPVDSLIPWDTHIGSFKFPDCVEPPVVEAVQVVAPVLSAGSDYENPDADGNYTLTWTRAAGAIGPDTMQSQPGASCEPFLTLDAEAGMGAWTAASDSPIAPTWQTSNAKPMHAPAAAFWAAPVVQDFGAGTATLTLKAPIAIPAEGTTTLRFLQYYQNESGDGSFAGDGGFVEVSTDNGATWSTVHVGGPNESAIATGATGAARFATEALMPAESDLTAYAGQSIRLRFRFLQDGPGWFGASQWGWYVDDVQLINNNWTDLTTTSATSLTQTGQADGAMCYRVRTTFEKNSQLVQSPFSNVLKVLVQHGSTSGGDSLLPDQCDPTGTLPDGAKCLSDIPVVGPALFGEGSGDGGVLPDQCDPTDTLPDDANCLSDIPVVGPALFGEGGGGDPVPGTENASCEQNKELGGNRSYQVKLTTYDGQVNSFQVLEPKTFDCANRANGAHPLLLQGHGYGGSRSTGGFDNYRNAGYAVISIDQRGFGGTSGTVRVMDPDFEGRYLVQILDWAEQNLDYLSWRDESTGTFIARPADKTSVANGANLVVGSTGGSYGGGYQLLLLAVDAKKRIDAAQPDITWHDLRNSLNPGDTIKSQYDTLLFGAGEATSGAAGLQNNPSVNTQDPYIKEAFIRGGASGEFPRGALDWFRYHSLSHWCGAAGLATMPYVQYGSELAPMVDPTGADNTPAPQAGRPGVGSLVVPTNPLTHFQQLSVRLTQGMADTLFNFNEAWWNAQCLSAAGAEVSLYTHNGGHGLVAATPGDAVNDFDGARCSMNNEAWMTSRLKPGTPTPSADVCFVFAAGDQVKMPFDKVLAPQPNLPEGTQLPFVERDVVAEQVPNGLAALTSQMGAEPVEIVLGTVEQNGILAGIPHVTVTVASLAGANELAQDCAPATVPTVRLGCDSVTLVGLGLRRAGSTDVAQLIDDQLRPLRGLGTHDVDLVGVAERLRVGDTLSLVLYGTHLQYFSSYSRDPTIPAVNVTGTVKLPIYGQNADGSPNFTTGQRVLSGGGVIDGDGDGIEDGVDNCPVHANAGQEDVDGDGLGDACDASDDRDFTPDAFAFATRTNVATSVYITSETRTITGITAPVQVVVGSNGQYRLNGGAWTSAQGTAVNGDSIAVRHVSASGPGQTTTTDVTVGTYATTFTSVTSNDDRTPDAFNFTTQNGVELATEIESNIVTPTGFNTTITVVPGAGSSVRINDGAWTTASTTMNPGDSLQTRHVSSSSNLSYTKTSVKVGTITAYFTTRTK